MAKAGITNLWRCNTCHGAGYVSFLYEVPAWQTEQRSNERSRFPTVEEYRLNEDRAGAEHLDQSGCLGPVQLRGGIIENFESAEHAEAWLKRVRFCPTTEPYDPFSSFLNPGKKLQ